MLNMREHKQAEQVLRLAKKSSLETPSDELAYQCRLAKKRLHQDRLVNRLEDGSRRREDLHKSSQLVTRHLVSKPSLDEDEDSEPGGDNSESWYNYKNAQEEERASKQ